MTFSFREAEYEDYKRSIGLYSAVVQPPSLYALDGASSEMVQNEDSGYGEELLEKAVQECCGVLPEHLIEEALELADLKNLGAEQDHF